MPSYNQSDLEEKYVEAFSGKVYPKVHLGDNKDKIKDFVDYMFFKKRIIEKFNEEIMGEFQEKTLFSKNIGNYHDYYCNRLIQETRNLKLKKII